MFRCGDLTILLLGLAFHCFVIENRKSLCHSLGRPSRSDFVQFEFGVMPSPKGSECQSAIIGGAALAIPQNGKNTELAKQFVQWLFEEEHYKEYLQLHKGLSVMNDVAYEPETDKAKEEFALMQAETDFVTDTFMTDESSSWRNYKDNEYRDALKRAVSGEITAKEALDGFAKQLSEASGWSMAY